MTQPYLNPIGLAYIRYQAAWCVANGVDASCLSEALIQDVFAVMEPPPVTFAEWCALVGLEAEARMIVEQTQIRKNTEVFGGQPNG